MTKYYNTNGLSGEQLQEATESALSQEKRILDFFKSNPKSSFTTHEIEDLLGINHDSVKRSITNLTQAGKLLKSDKTVQGFYGRPCHQWSLLREVQSIEVQVKEAA